MSYRPFKKFEFVLSPFLANRYSLCSVLVINAAIWIVATICHCVINVFKSGFYIRIVFSWWFLFTDVQFFSFTLNFNCA